MSATRRKQPPGRPGRSRPPKPVDFWRPTPEFPEPEPIVAANDPTALLRSLGDPPLGGISGVAGQYLGAVIERAAVLATALAASADLLADPADD